MSKIIIISGEKHSGKTRKITQIAEQLQNCGEKICGIVSIGSFTDGKRTSFKLMDISSKQIKPFMLVDNKDNFNVKLGSFYVDTGTLNWGKSILQKAITSDCRHCFIDEVGKWELSGEGWAEELKLLTKTEKKIYIAVRSGFVEDVLSYFKIENYEIIHEK